MDFFNRSIFSSTASAASFACCSLAKRLSRIRTISTCSTIAFIQRDKIDYATAFATIPEEYHRSLFKSAWGSSVRKAAKSFFTNYSTTIIQTILDAPVITPEVLQEAQENLLEIVKANQKNRKKLTSLLNTANCTDQNVLATQARLDAAAKITASRRIDQLNSIYQESRLLLPQYNLPLIQIPHLNLDKYIPLEQCKALPLEFIVQLTSIFLGEIDVTALSVGGILLACCMLRSSEACAPKFENIIDCGDFGVYAVRTKVDSATIEVVDALKSDAAYRVIIIPKFGMHALHLRKAQLKKSGLTEDEIGNTYVVSRNEDPFSPASPEKLSLYVKGWMEALGCNNNFWESVSLLMQQEPDMDEFGRPLPDPTTYSLRRSGCSYLMNCAASPRLSGEHIPLFVLVDLLMGHKLKHQDIKWKNWLNRQDNWPLVAQMLETVILDPEHSSHPAFAKAGTKFFPEKICHTCQKLYIPDGIRQITITVQAHSVDDIVVSFPQHGKAISHKQIVLPKESSSMPVIQEEIDRTFYEKAIGAIKKKFSKERGVSIEQQDIESVQGNQTDSRKET